MAIKLHFNESDIYQKQFKTRLNGYDPKQVNSFLDLVMVDYQTLKQGITKLQQQNDYLHYHITPLKQEIANIRNRDMKRQTDIGLQKHAYQVKIQKNLNKIHYLQQQLQKNNQYISKLHSNFNNKIQNLNNRNYLSKLDKQLLTKHAIYKEYPWRNPQNTLKILERLEKLEKLIK